MRKPLSLIIAPFGKTFAPVEKLVRETLENLGIEVAQFDQISSGAVWATAVTDAIKSADFVVVDITNQNENVIYELGVAHTMRKPTVLICSVRSKTPLPLVLSGFSVIVYEPEDLQSLASLIRHAVRPLVSEAVARYA
jgi:hypothetical protein